MFASSSGSARARVEEAAFFEIVHAFEVGGAGVVGRVEEEALHAGVLPAEAPADLEALLIERFGLNYDTLTNRLLPWVIQTINVHRYFDFRNETEQLVAALRDARPSVPELAMVADSVGFATVRTAELEVLVQHQDTPFQDVDAFRARLAAIEAATCQIDMGGTLGTGTLIGADLVMTNCHVVVSRIGANGELTGPATCRFDYKTNGAGYTTPPVNALARKLLASSPYAPEDLVVGPMATNMHALDYAILELDRAIADDPVIANGEPRGHIDVSAAPATALDAGVLVLQHPGGKPMKIDLGSVVDLGQVRFRHTVNTEPGSSGAPVFDAALRMIGIHHAGQNGGPGPGLTYNEAIPLGAILNDARAKGVAI